MKFIIVPLSKEAEIKMHYDQENEDEVYLWTIADDEFFCLERKDVFDDMFKITGLWMELADFSALVIL